MDIITFPSLNLEFKVSNIAFNIFGIKIYWYAIFIVLGFILALILCKKDDGKYRIKFYTILDMFIFVIPISIISARLYYVIFKLDYYINNPNLILNIQNGGLAIYGGIIGGLITCYIFCKKRKIELLNLLDYIVPNLALRTSNRQMGKFYKCRSIW